MSEFSAEDKPRNTGDDFRFLTEKSVWRPALAGFDALTTCQARTATDGNRLSTGGVRFPDNPGAKNGRCPDALIGFMDDNQNRHANGIEIIRKDGLSHPPFSSAFKPRCDGRRQHEAVGCCGTGQARSRRGACR